MQTKKCLILILLTTLTLSQTTPEPQTETSLQINKNKFCSTKSLSSITLSNKEFSKNRKNSQNMYSSKYEEIVEYLSEKDNSKLFSAFLPYAILFFLILFIIFFSTIFFFTTFCRKNEFGTKKHFCVNFACTFAIISFLLFIFIIVFLVFSQLTFEDSMCALYSSAVLLYEGSTEYPDFIGTQNLEKIFENSATDFALLKTQRTDFAEIYAKNPSSATNKGFKSVINYAKNNKNKKIANGAGEEKTPKTSFFLNPTINPIIDSEFNFLNQIGFEIQKSAQIGKNSNTYATIEESSKTIKNKLSTLNENLKNLLNPLTEDIQAKMDLGKLAYFSILSFGIVLYILILIEMIILLKANKQKQKISEKICPKILLVVISLFLLIFAIFVFLLLIASVGVSSFCGLVSDLNEGDVSVLTSFEEKLDVGVLDLLEVCFSEKSDGNLKNVFLSEKELILDYERVLGVLKGVSAYEHFLGNFTNSDSRGILEENKNLDLLASGEVSGFYEVDKEIEKLNNLVDCSENFFALNAKNCETGKICQEIKSLQNFTPPTCASSKSEITQKFENLKSYTTSSTEFTTLLKSELTKTKNSPQTNFSNSQKPSFQQTPLTPKFRKTCKKRFFS